MFDDESAPTIIMAISPEPTPIERDAIIAALVVLRSRRTASSTPHNVPTATRWQRTARREAVRSGDLDQGLVSRHGE